MFKFINVLFVALTVFSATSALASEPLFAIDRPNPNRSGISPVARDLAAHSSTFPSVNKRENTNAARLARGLAPFPPKFGRFAPGRRTPTVAARSPNPSNVPVSGTIKVTRADNGNLVGYVARDFVNPGTPRHGVTSDSNSALTVAFTGGTNPLEIRETNGPDASYPFLGAVVGPASDSDDLSTGSPNYSLITATGHSAAGAPPSPVDNAYSAQNSESTIWNFNTVTSELTATWINTNGAAAPTSLYHLPGSNGLLLVGDPTAFDAAFPGGYPVKYTVI